MKQKKEKLKCVVKEMPPRVKQSGEFGYIHPIFKDSVYVNLPSKIEVVLLPLLE